MLTERSAEEVEEEGRGERTMAFPEGKEEAKKTPRALRGDGGWRVGAVAGGGGEASWQTQIRDSLERGAEPECLALDGCMPV